MFNFSKGVTNDMSFTLHDAAMPGNWSLEVVTRGQVQDYVFWVEYYTLPLANVTIHLPEFVEVANPILNYKVDAFYTFGKPVQGRLEIILEKIKDCRDGGEKFYRIQTSIQGQFSQGFDIRNTPLISSDCAEIRFNVTANVYDDVTKSVYTNYEEFSVFKTHIRANMMPINKMRPGHTFTKEVKIID